MLAQSGPPMLAAFLASVVEAVEALTVVLAVGSVRGWRDAVLGAGAALVVLAVLVASLGATLIRLPLPDLQIGVGALLVLFGMRWLRKAILRAAGVLALHDEAAAYASQTDAMRGHAARAGWDAIAFGAAFQITMLEGAEVVFIVIGVAAGGPQLLRPAVVGAAAAVVLVLSVGMALRRPLSLVPENALKFAVGVLLSAFGTFWFGEGVGVAWPGADWSLLALVAGFGSVAAAAVMLCRARWRSGARRA